MAIKSIIPKFQDYANRKAEADAVLQSDLERAAQRYQPEAMKGYEEKKRTEHDTKWRAEFEKLSGELTRQLDTLQSGLEKKLNTKAEGYDTRLANTLAMLSALDEAAIKSNKAAVIAQTMEFTGDPLARASIAAIVGSKAPMLTAELFDTETEAKLNAVTTARRFADRYSSNEQYIPNDLEIYCERYGLE